MAVKETRQNYSEPQVKQIIDKIVKATDKAVFVMHASRDIDRFKSLKENEIDRCHHTLGRWIRNNWELGPGSLNFFQLNLISVVTITTFKK